MTEDSIDKLIELALDEDIGCRDITTSAIVAEGKKSRAQIIAKKPLVVAGLDVAKRVFRKLDPKISWRAVKKDGDHCKSKDVLAEVRGRTLALLAAERTALNFLQHLSGIATLTNAFVKKIERTKTKILDTRKTTPGLRLLEKHAVRMGGGTNHRIGLFDRYLIKSNHISAVGSISRAINLVNKNKKKGLLLEVEAQTPKDVKEALKHKVDIIMLDNMTANDVRRAVSIIKTQAKTEVSGNITLRNIAQYASTGIDFISIGEITHSAPAADIHMKIFSD